MNVETYLEGTLVDNPDGIKELTQSIEYKTEYRGLFTYIEGDLKFLGDGYDYLENSFFTSPCSLVEFLLKINNVDYFDGMIDVSDISEANLTRRELSAPIQDNNLSTYITKNSKIKTFINVTRTKNGESITAATRVTVDFFTPSTGNYDYNFSDVYPVGDAFRYLVEWMSDGNVTCSSPLFDSGGDLYGICIMNGKTISKTGAAAPEISFHDLFSEMNKLFNIAMYVDFSSALPEIIIDKYDNVFSNTNLLTFSDVNNLKLRFDKNSFYSRVLMGSKKFQEYSNGTFTFPDATFLGFDDEEYFVGGQCNIDTELDLVNEWIIDTNVIEDALIYDNDSYDEDTFIVEVNLSTNDAVKFDNLIPTGYVYNQGLTNNKKAEYWLGAVPNNILAYLNNAANNFEATKNSVILATGNLLHPTEITDPGNNYDTVTGRYTCPIGGDGVYTFNFQWSGASYTEPEGTVTATVQLVHYDSGGVSLGSVNLHTFVSTIGDLDGNASAGFYLAASDYVRIECTVLAGTTSYGFSTFSGDFADEGGVYQAYDPNANRVYELEFEVPTTYTQYLNIRNNITQSITVNSGQNTFIGWVKSIKRNIVTGMTKFILKTSNKDNTKRRVTR